MIFAVFFCPSSSRVKDVLPPVSGSARLQRNRAFLLILFVPFAADTRCIDYSDTNHPVLWIISGHAWYKVAGSGWWDFVAPHPIYAPVFEPSRKSFALTCLVARALQSRYASIRKQLQVLSDLFLEPDLFLETCTGVTARLLSARYVAWFGPHSV